MIWAPLYECHDSTIYHALSIGNVVQMFHCILEQFIHPIQHRNYFFDTSVIIV